MKSVEALVTLIVRVNLKCKEGGLSDMGGKGARLGYFCAVKTFLQRVNSHLLGTNCKATVLCTLAGQVFFFFTNSVEKGNTLQDSSQSVLLSSLPTVGVSP